MRICEYVNQNVKQPGIRSDNKINKYMGGHWIYRSRSRMNRNRYYKFVFDRLLKLRCLQIVMFTNFCCVIDSASGGSARLMTLSETVIVPNEPSA